MLKNPNNKIIQPLQSWGLGDIIFTQTLVRKIADGAPIIWGVESMFLDGLQRAYGGGNVTFVNKETLTDVDYNLKEDKIIGDKRILPIRWADTILNVPYNRCMAAKYELYKQDFTTWKEQAMFKRDEVREQQLYDFLKLKKGMKYNLVNRYFRSNNSGAVDVKPENDYPCIEMKAYRNFSIFDWARMIEGAAEIHVANSAITFILELLKLPKKTKIHLYARRPDEKDFANTEYLFTKPYILH